MDKILLTAFLSALAGFITAILSIVKLVNEKESKTTEYRQSWTDSVRRAFADLIARINSQAGQIANAGDVHSDIISIASEKDPDNPLRERALNYSESALKELRLSVSETRRSIYEAYALTRLHFKPNDLSFNRVEQKFDVIMAILNEISNSNDEAKRAELREKVYAASNEIAGYARDILKTEWETVKRGEPAYQRTKKWSIYGSIVMLFLLISIGIHAGISIWKQSIEKDQAVRTKSDTGTSILGR